MTGTPEKESCALITEKQLDAIRGFVALTQMFYPKEPLSISFNEAILAAVAEIERLRNVLALTEAGKGERGK